MTPEVRGPEEQRFLALCMLMMGEHPRVGASYLAVHRGEASPYVKGWNVVRGIPGKSRSRWIFIGSDSGYAKWTQPDVDQRKIHESDYTPPPLEQTTAWTWAVHLANNHRCPEWAQKRIAYIKEFSDRLDLHHDPAAEYEAVASALERLKKMASLLVDRFALAEHLLSIISPFLDLEENGSLAEPVLTAVLTNIANFVSDYDPAEAQILVRKTLGERVAALLQARIGRRPGAFEQITYLAGLYASTALTHSNLIRSQFSIRQDQISLMGKWDQNLDEMLAHDILPYLVYSAMPTVERALRIGEKGWNSMSQKYGTVGSPQFAFGESEIGDYGPCTMQLLQQAAERLHRFFG
jgi:hypothetical protein